MSKLSYEDVLTYPERWLTDRQRRWLRPRGAFARTAHTLFHFVNMLFVRLLFRFSVKGHLNLPASGPFIITPNHSSPLDLPILAAALPLGLQRQAYWTGKESTVLRTWLRRTLSWCTRIVPIAEDVTAIAPAVKILERGDKLIWFPEGARSLDGELLAFKPGIGGILTKFDVPVVPVFSQGAHAAFPAGQTMPRLRARVVVWIGSPETAQRLGLQEGGKEDINRVADALRQRVMQLRDQSRQ